MEVTGTREVLSFDISDSLIGMGVLIAVMGKGLTIMVGDLVQLKHDFRFIALGFPFPMGDLAFEEGLLAL